MPVLADRLELDREQVVVRQVDDVVIVYCERSGATHEFSDFDGAFLCATLMEIRALSQIEDFEYETAQHPLFRQVVNDFRALTHA